MSEKEQARHHSRATQTWIITGAIAVAAVVAVVVPQILEQRREYERIYPGCWRLIGRDQQCEMRVNTAAFLAGR